MRVFITHDCLRITAALVSSSSGAVICLGIGVLWDEFGGIYSTPLLIQDLESPVC